MKILNALFSAFYALAVLIFLVYLLVSFVLWELNPLYWQHSSPSFYAYIRIGIIAFVILFVIFYFT